VQHHRHFSVYSIRHGQRRQERFARVETASGTCVASGAMNEPIATQDPKYSIVSGRLVNAATLNAIPDDEPLFILRGRDLHALDTLWPYLDACPPGPHRDAIRTSIARFERFARDNPDRMKEPDTAPMC
jgi:hypothetical protein